MVVNCLITNPRWEWDVVGAYLTEESIVRGVLTTIELTAITAALGFALGTVLALMRLSQSPAAAVGELGLHLGVPLGAADRAAAVLVQPRLPVPDAGLRHPVRPVASSRSTLSLIDRVRRRGARARACTRPPTPPRSSGPGILSVDQGQHEAAAALGIPRRRQFTRIVLPQAMRTILPTAVNEVIGLFKGTSIVYVMAHRRALLQGAGDLRPHASGSCRCCWSPPSGTSCSPRVLTDRPVLRRAALRPGRGAHAAADAAADGCAATLTAGTPGSAPPDEEPPDDRRPTAAAPGRASRSTACTSPSAATEVLRRHRPDGRAAARSPSILGPVRLGQVHPAARASTTWRRSTAGYRQRRRRADRLPAGAATGCTSCARTRRSCGSARGSASCSRTSTSSRT